MKPPAEIIDTAIQYINKADAEGVFWNTAAGPENPQRIVRQLEDLKLSIKNDRKALKFAWDILIDGYDNNQSMLDRFIEYADDAQYD
jgi:hypothetical protein